MKRILFVFILSLFLLPTALLAQDSVSAEDLEQTLIEIQEMKDRLSELNEIVAEDQAFPEFETRTEEIKVKITAIVSNETIDGVHRVVFMAEGGGMEYRVDTSQSFPDGLKHRLKVGGEVYLQTVWVDQDLSAAFFIDVVRISSLFWISLLFAVLIILVGLRRGVSSLAGLAITLMIIFGFLLPRILAGGDPVFWTVLSSIVILGVNMHLSHGFSRSTFFAYGSTVVGLVFVLIFAKIFVVFTNLSGVANEETYLLVLNAGEVLIPRGILLSGIILGAVGVLDDIAITQTEAVEEIQKANPKLSRNELFKRAMNIGRHHIASTVNTLVLAYVGVALPLLLLFMVTDGMTALRFLNEELVAEEIVRTLAGTMALVLTVPISTWFATISKKR